MSRSGRANDAMRPVVLERGVVRQAEGSCLSAFGNTRVLCAVSVEDGVPGWRKGSGEGWITPSTRCCRARRGRARRVSGSQIGGRTQEIQRLIGRSVRAMLDDFRFGEVTLRVDCDVLEADGGTRTAAITGACVAVVDAFDWLVAPGRLRGIARSGGASPRSAWAWSTASRAWTSTTTRTCAPAVDMNVVMSSEGRFVEVQGTGEHGTFDRAELDRLLALAVAGIGTLDGLQRAALGTR